MTSRNTSAGSIHPRARDLGKLIDRLNLWAMAPDDEHRTKALKAVLSAYRKAVKTKQYAPMNRNFAMRTGYCNEAPPPLTDSFESFFGAPEEDTADNNDLPWKE